MTIERCFALIKPDAVANGDIGHIISRIEKEKLKIDRIDFAPLTPQTVDALYADHLARDFYPAMREFMLSGPVVLLVLSGDDTINRWRRIMGPTDPKASVASSSTIGMTMRTGFNAMPTVTPQHTIRALYGDKSGPMFRNAVHGSDSVDAAEREIAIFFQEAK